MKYWYTAIGTKVRMPLHTMIPPRVLMFNQAAASKPPSSAVSVLACNRVTAPTGLLLLLTLQLTLPLPLLLTLTLPPRRAAREVATTFPRRLGPSRRALVVAIAKAITSNMATIGRVVESVSHSRMPGCRDAFLDR